MSLLLFITRAALMVTNPASGQHRPWPTELRLARQSVASYLETLASAFIAAANHMPPAEDLDRL